MKRLSLHNNYLTMISFGIVLVCVLQVLVFPKSVFAATPVVDSTSNGPVGSRTITWQHTVGTDSNRMLLVAIEGNGQNVSSVTYNGIAVPSLISKRVGTSGLDIYGLLNPPSGTHAIVVQGSSTLMGNAVSLSNVNQTDPFPSAQYIGSCQGITSNVCYSSITPSQDTELWFQWTSLDDPDTLTFTPMATAITIWNMRRGNTYFASEYIPGINGTITPSWNISPNTNNYTYGNTVDAGVQAAPTPTPTPTPTPQIYTISGTVINDGNKNGLQDAGESNYASTPSITASRGTVTTHSDGTYTISNLTAGTVTISYTSLPSGYNMTYPLNGPPSSFQVTVGPGCDTNGAKGSLCQ